MSGDFVSAGFTGWAVEALIASTILMTFVLLARKEAQRALGPQLAYWLWALPALRMAMPPMPASWRESAAAPLTAASETVLWLAEPIVHPVAKAAIDDPFPWLLAMVGVWVVGGVLFFVWHSLAHLSYVRRIVAPPATRAQLPDGITLVESDEAVGPVAFGIFKRFVAVPSDFAERYDADERKLALAHELGHHARGDLIANWVGLAMLACHWFNPIAWIAYRKFRADQEMANDARVLSALPPIERHAYACAIVKAAHGRAVTAACHLHTIEDLKGRLRMLKASRKSRRVLMAGAVGIASLTVAGLGLTASGAAAEKIRTVAETQFAEMVADPVDPAVEAAIGADGKTTVRDVNVVIKDKDGKVVDLGDDAKVPAGAKVYRKVVINRDGKVTTFEGPAADAYIAAHPGQHVNDREGAIKRNRLVIRTKDGKVTTYNGAEAEAYLKAHPEMRAPLPPVPPVPPVPAVSTITGPDGQMIITTGSGKTQIKRVVRTGPGRYAYATGSAVEVVEGDCGPGNPREFVRRSEKKGEARMVICTKRIEAFASDQARMGKRTALSSLIASRAAIQANRGLSDAQRAQALAGIDEARADLEREIREGKDN